MNMLTKPSLIALALVAVLAGGCGQSSTQSDPVVAHAITRHTASVVDGMLLADHAGPKAQIHYAGQPNPDFFCNTADMFHHYLVPEQMRKVRALFVQDMGKADWEQPVGHWIDARSAWYVAGSSRRGSMGPTLGTFASEADARGFVEEFGGRVLQFDDVTLEVVAPPDDRLPPIGS